MREKRIVSPPRQPRDSRSYPIASGAAMPGDPSRGILAGDDTWLLQWRSARGWAPYYLFLGFLVHAGRNEAILKARPVVEPRARRVRGTRSACGPRPRTRPRAFPPRLSHVLKKKGERKGTKGDDARSSDDYGDVRDWRDCE